METAEERSGARPEAGPFFTLAEVAKRSTDREAWLVIHDRVYDVTRFLDEVGARAAGGKRGRVPRRRGCRCPGPHRGGWLGARRPPGSWDAPLSGRASGAAFLERAGRESRFLAPPPPSGLAC